MGVSNIIGGSGRSKKVYQRSDRSAQDNVLAEEDNVGLVVPRFIYSKLSNFTNHKTISLVDMETEDNEYKFFMMELERFYNTSNDIDNIEALDEYLGSLGITTIYPFADDSYTAPSWIKLSEGLVDRNIVAIVNGIAYNIITTMSGTDYNVIHSPNT